MAYASQNDRLNASPDRGVKLAPLAVGHARAIRQILNPS